MTSPLRLRQIAVHASAHSMWLLRGKLRSPRFTTKVVAIGPRVPHDTRQDDEHMFELQPSQELPVLDLARTLKSEFFTPSMTRAFNAIRRHPLEQLIAYLLTTTSYFVIMFVPASVGGYVALVAVLIGIPGNFLVIGQLRYDILKLHTRTFDVWFSSIMWLAFFLILATMFNDLRAVIVVSFWLGSWPNVCHDACLVTIRPIVIFNIICVFVSAMIVLCVNVGITDGLQDVVVMRVGDHVLSAKAIVTDGFMTIAAFMSRNVYRRRDIVMRRAQTRDLECVIYRCQLKVVQRSPHKQIVPHSQLRAASDHIDVPGHVQAMRLVRFVDGIDARNTLVPRAHSWLMAAHTKVTVFIPLAAYVGILSTVCSSLSMMSTLSTIHIQKTALAVGFALAVFHSCVSAVLYNRTLLGVVYTSFDFVFIMFQVTSVHFCVCDLFEWDASTILLSATSWLWIHWLLLLDALVPPVRSRLHIHRLLPRFGVLCCTMGGFVLVYALIFASPPAQVVDRVLFSGKFMDHTVSYRLLPQFYSSLATSLFLSLRICWRQWWLNGHDLVIIDGPVVFTNSFARVRTRSVAPTSRVRETNSGSAVVRVIPPTTANVR